MAYEIVFFKTVYSLQLNLKTCFTKLFPVNEWNGILLCAKLQKDLGYI